MTTGARSARNIVSATLPVSITPATRQLTASPTSPTTEAASICPATAGFGSLTESATTGILSTVATGTTIRRRGGCGAHMHLGAGIPIVMGAGCSLLATAGCGHPELSSPAGVQFHLYSELRQASNPRFVRFENRCRERRLLRLAQLQSSVRDIDFMTLVIQCSPYEADCNGLGLLPPRRQARTIGRHLLVA